MKSRAYQTTPTPVLDLLPSLLTTKTNRPPGGVPIGRFVPGYVQDINYALWAPAGTPPDIAAKLTASVRQALDEPGMTEKFTGFSVPLAVSGPAEVNRILEREAGLLLR